MSKDKDFSGNSFLEPEEIEQIITTETIDPNNKIPPPEVALKIVDDSGKEIIFGSLGNLSMLSGKAKARKSFIVTVAVAAAIGSKMMLNKFKGCLPKNKRHVLLIDTEQGAYHASLVGNRIKRLSSDEALKHLKFINLRKYSTEERIDVIEYKIKNTPDIGLVIIDGIRDLVADINSPVEATGLKDWLLKLSEQYNIHIMVVLHTNPKDKKPRGHAGTELINKCETTAIVEVSEYDKDVSVITAEYTRNISFKDFAFKIDDNGLPVSCEIPYASQKSKPGFYPEDMSDEEHFNSIKKIFPNGDIYNAGELVEKIVLSFGEQKIKIGNSLAKRVKTYWLDKNWIDDKGTGQERKYVSSF